MLTFNTILILIAVVLILLFLTCLCLLIECGLFYDIVVGGKKPTVSSPLVLAYKAHTGPYKQSGDAFTWLSAYAPGFKLLGIYYDDPATTPANELRYAVGCVLNNSSNSSDVLKESVAKLEKEDYSFCVIPAADLVIESKFPFINTLSCIIAIKRVYPKLRSYMGEKKLEAHPFFEYYDDTFITFYAPLSNFSAFTVPEFQNDGATPFKRYSDIPMSVTISGASSYEDLHNSELEDFESK